MVPRLVVALLLVTAGCTAADGGSPATPSATPTSTPTVDRPATSSPASTSTPPTTVTDTPPTSPTESNTVAYGSLSPTQQRAFDRAVAGRAQFVDADALDSPYVGDGYYARDVATPFWTHEYVRKDGTHYRLSYRESGGEVLAAYGIEATREEPPADADVVALENVSPRARDPVRWAAENGSYYAPAGKWPSLPQGFDRFDYVRVSGDTYRISVTYGDFFAAELRVERVA